VAEGLFVGRFQPFHLGHLAAIRYALRRVDFLYIGIGSANRSHELKNPFTTAERLQMIRIALRGKVGPNRYLPIPIPDVEQHSSWVSVVRSLVPPFQVVFSNDPLTVRLFEEEGIRVEAIPLYKREAYSATNVRRRMLGGKAWKHLVPSGVAKFLEQTGAIARLKALAAYAPREEGHGGG
jgi:nicotinamide-nucleotide adenylyltransferase